MRKCNTNQRLFGWPFLTSVLRSVSCDVQSASVDDVWGWIPSRYYIKVEPHSREFWKLFKLKFPDWIVYAKRFEVDLFAPYTPWFYSVTDLVSWLSDTMKRPEIRNLLLLECTKYLAYQGVKNIG